MDFTKKFEVETAQEVSFSSKGFQERDRSCGRVVFKSCEAVVSCARIDRVMRLLVWIRNREQYRETGWCRVEWAECTKK